MTRLQHGALKVGDRVVIRTPMLDGVDAQVERTHQGDPPCVMVIRHVDRGCGDEEPVWYSPTKRGNYSHIFQDDKWSARVKCSPSNAAPDLSNLPARDALAVLPEVVRTVVLEGK